MATELEVVPVDLVLGEEVHGLEIELKLFRLPTLMDR
jgi:hypothetical protein